MELSSQDPDADADVGQTGQTRIIWNHYKSDGFQSNRGGAKNVTYNFCDAPLTGCSPSQAYAHILGRAVLGQRRPNFAACITVYQYIKPIIIAMHNSKLRR